MTLGAYLFRTHVAPKAAIALLAVEAFNIANRGLPWRGELVWTIDWLGTVLTLVGPVVAGAAAVDAGRFARAGTEYLTGRTVLANRVYMLTWLAAAIPAMVVHLAAAMTIVALSNPRSQISMWPSVFAVIAQLCGIGFYAALGSVCGRYTGSVAGGPIAVVAGIVLFWQFGTSPERFSVLMFGRATSSVLGLQFNVAYSVAQIVCLALISLVLVLLPVRVISGIRRPPHIVSAMIVVAVAGALVVFPYISSDRFVPVAIRPTSCTGKAPIICMYPDHDRFLSSVDESAKQVYFGASALGVQDLLPTRIVERLPGEGPASDGAGRFQIPLESFSTDHVTPEVLAIEIVVPHHCPALYGDLPPPIEFGWDLYRAAYTLVSASQGQTGGDPMQPGEILSAAELKRLLTSFKNCQLG
ncbi:MAG TPA: hypothetical protein VF174_03885 [Micromonosporaceae bacterium]